MAAVNHLTRGPSVRNASHAGSWYSDDAQELDKQLAEWMDKAPTETRQPIKALISPHAGLSYSGWTAAHVYKHLCASLRGIRRIFILGPSHHVHINGCGLTPFTHYATPLGNLSIDREVTEALLKASSTSASFRVVSEDVDEAEHSIELQLPFLAKALVDPKTGVVRSDVALVPVIVGSVNPKQEAAFGKIFAPYLDDDSSLFCISSDFCHWGSRFDYTFYNTEYRKIHESIEALDREGMDLIARKDMDGWWQYLQRTRNTICGRHPISVFLAAVLAARAPLHLQFVHYAQSSQVVSRQDSSVSYAACLVTMAPLSGRK